MSPPDTAEFPPLPAGYAVRNATRDDLPRIAALVAADEIAVLGEVMTTAADLAADWEYANWVPERDTWVTLSPDDDLRGYAWCHSPNPHSDPDGMFWTWPDESATVVGRHLLARVLKRAADMATDELERDAPTLGLWCAHDDDSRQRLYSEAGSIRTRAFFRMTIESDDVSEQPRPPAGIELRPFRRPEDERRFHTATQESFERHFRWFYEPFDDWRERVFSHPSLDLGLWVVAWAGEEVAGVVKCQSDDALGHVDMLAVCKPWRGRGLGLALLLHAFSLLKARGFATITLGVDAENSTGALCLYERAGMTVRQAFDFYEKPLACR